MDSHGGLVNLVIKNIPAFSDPYLNVQVGADYGEFRADQSWRTSKVLAAGFSQQNSFDLSTPIAHPEAGTLLLVEVIHH
jgi:hypothetical protein